MTFSWSNPDADPIGDIKKIIDAWSVSTGISINYLIANDVARDKKIIFYSPPDTTDYVSKFDGTWEIFSPPMSREQIEEIYGKENVKFSYYFSYI